MSRLAGAGANDPEYVRRQYASESGLAARKALYRDVTVPDARDVLVAAVAEAAPRRVLEVGCGEGELAARLVVRRRPCVFVADGPAGHAARG